jgi:hypothetical protein
LRLACRAGGDVAILDGGADQPERRDAAFVLRLVACFKAAVMVSRMNRFGVLRKKLPK